MTRKLNFSSKGVNKNKNKFSRVTIVQIKLPFIEQLVEWLAITHVSLGENVKALEMSDWPLH